MKMPTSLRKFLNSTPPLFRGGRLLNTLGLQVARSVFHNLGRFSPGPVRPEFQEYLKELDENGILIIPKFLPSDAFERIWKEYSDYYSKRGVSTGIQRDDNKNFKDYFSNVEEFFDLYNSPLAEQYFVKNPLILDLISAVTRRKIAITPNALFWTHRKVNDIDAEDLRKQYSANFLHADVSYPAFKIFFYLNDVSTDNGAFVFAPKSHKLNKQRLLLDYKLSREQNYGILSDDKAKELGFAEKSICGSANTLVIFNAMGFHRRGEFKGLNRRDTLHIDFRFLESPRNQIKTILSYFKG